MRQVIHQHVPNLVARLQDFPDHRERKEYKVSELLMGAISMFLFKEGSRNHYNQLRREKKFRENYRRLFKLNLPHMDTVEDFLRILEPTELEKLKATLVAALIENKLFYRFRFLGRSYTVAVDATGVNSHSGNYSTKCLIREHSETTTYHDYVMEAKLVCANGLSVSLASEWIENDGTICTYKKQDCELNAFKRLAIKLKNYFPRLPVTILADGLYPNKGFFGICKENGWGFIITFKDASLKTLQEEIISLKNLKSAKQELEKTDEEMICRYHWLLDLYYHEFKLQWIEYSGYNSKNNEKEYFVYLTNIEITRENVCEMVTAGRMRWKIEKQGFDHQKNHGYNLGHKYSRISENAVKNYYQCLQIAHLMEQLTILSIDVHQMLVECKCSMNYCWFRLKSLLINKVRKEGFYPSKKTQCRLL